jgi:MFS family permease
MSDPASPPPSLAPASGFIDREARNEFLRLCLLTFLIFFLNAHASMLAIIFTRHGLVLHDIGWLLSLYGVPVVLFTFATGTAAALIGSLWTARIGIGLMLIGFLSLGVTAWSFWPALCSRLMWGAGYGLMFSSLVTYAQSRLTKDRFVYLFGLFSSMAPISHALAPPWVEFLLRFDNDPIIFMIGACPAAVALVLTFALRPLAKPAATQKLIQLGAAFDRARWLPLISVLISGALFGFISSYMAAAMQEKGIAQAWFFTATVFAMLSTRFLAMGTFSKFSARRVVTGGLVVMSLAYLCLALTRTDWIIALCGLSFGSGYSVVYPVVSNWMSGSLPPQERAGPQAAFNAIFHVGLLWMPLPVTYVIGFAGFSGALLVLGSLGLIFAAIILFWEPERPATPF